MFIKLIFYILLHFICAGIFAFPISGQNTNPFASKPFQKCWENSDTVSALIASDNAANFFLQTSHGKIKSLNSYGEENWNLELGSETVSKPVYLDGTLYILLRIDNLESIGNIQHSYSVAAVNSVTGLVRWRVNFSSNSVPFLAIHKENAAVFFTREDGSELKLLDAATGNFITERKFDFVFSKLYAVSEESIVFGTAEQQVGFLSISGGKVKSFNIGLDSIETGLVNGEFAVLSDKTGGLYLLNSLGILTNVKIRLGGKASSILFYNKRYLVSSYDNFLYLISEDAKKIIWKKRFAGRITERPIINQDNFIVFSQGDNTLYFIDPDDGKTLNQINLHEGEQINASPIILGDRIIMNTSTGMKAFSPSKCENRTNT